MQITPANCEQHLIDVMESCTARGLTSPEALWDDPDKGGLMEAMRAWAELRALTSGCNSSLLFRMNEHAEDIASFWVIRFWEKGKDPENPWPRLRQMLDLVARNGCPALPRYLMTCVNNIVLDIYDQYMRGRGRICLLTRRNPDGSISILPLDTLPDTRTPDALQQLIHREEMERFLSHMGEDLLQDLGFLSRGTSITIRRMAEIIFGGGMKTLCRQMVSLIGSNLTEDYTPAWEPFLRAADAFVLPVRITSIDALERHMYRKTDVRGTQRFLRRVGKRPA